MSENISDYARRRLEELDAAAKGLAEQLKTVNAERAQIHRLLGGKPTKALQQPALEPPAERIADKPARRRKAALGSWKDEAPGQEDILAAVVNRAPAGAAQAPTEGGAS